MPIFRGQTKAARKVARATLGPLCTGGGRKRQERNQKAAAFFYNWALLHSFSTTDTSTIYLTTTMNQFVMDCWQEGEGKDVCCSAIYGICALLGLESKQAFKHSWKLLKKWGSLELPLQAPPAQREEA